MQEAWDCLRGAVTIAYPEGLPEYDEVVRVLSALMGRPPNELFVPGVVPAG